MSNKDQFEIHHIALSVKDIDKSIDFYNMFGFTVYKRFHIEKFNADVAMLKLGLCKLELFAFQNHKPLPPYRSDLQSDLEVIGTKHFALSVNDLDQTIAYLRSVGVVVNMEPVTGSSGFRYIFVHDPDGILIEVIEAGLR